MKSKVIAIDLDGTICSEEKTFEKSLATPNPGSIKALQKMSSDGHILIIWTARGWDQYRMTKEWLTKHDIPFDQLIMGKPIVDIFIDDRARQFTSWDNDYVNQ